MYTLNKSYINTKKRNIYSARMFINFHHRSPCENHSRLQAHMLKWFELLIVFASSPVNMSGETLFVVLRGAVSNAGKYAETYSAHAPAW